MRAAGALAAAEAFALPFYAGPHRAYHTADHVRASWLPSPNAAL